MPATNAFDVSVPLYRTTDLTTAVDGDVDADAMTATMVTMNARMLLFFIAGGGGGSSLLPENSSSSTSAEWYLNSTGGGGVGGIGVGGTASAVPAAAVEFFNDGRRNDEVSLNYALPAMIVVAVLLAVFVFVTAFGNFLVGLALYRYSALRTVSNYLIGNLAVSATPFLSADRK